jgi:hypothetical protein
MLSIEEDQLMASLARLDVKLRHKPTRDCAVAAGVLQDRRIDNNHVQVPVLPASRHPKAASLPSHAASRARVTTGNTNTFASARK